MPGTASESKDIPLLASSSYDNGISSSHSHQLSDSEDDQVTHGAQTSLELAEFDRCVLEEEEDREKLLGSQSCGQGVRAIVKGGNSHGSQVRIGRRERRRRRKAAKGRKGGKDDEQGELMYEMEEGGRKDDASSESSGSSSELDKQKFHDVFTGGVRQYPQVLDIIRLTYAASSLAVSSAYRYQLCDRSPLRNACLRGLQVIS